jgi:alkylated DNA repair dioxygenase AlkB
MECQANVNPFTGRFFYPPTKWANGTAEWEQSRARLVVVPGAVACLPANFEKAWCLLPPPTPNPMNPKTMIKRRQCVWGPSDYNFAGQKSARAGDLDEAPSIVRDAVDDATKRLAEFGVDPDTAEVFAHCNFYPDHDAALSPHQDDESIHLPGCPIFSYTFVSPPPEKPDLDWRYFVVQDRPGVVPGASRATHTWPVPLRSGDLAIMAGDFQKCLWHGVPAAPVRFRGQRRINVTVRCLARAVAPPPPKRARVDGGASD